MSGIEAAVYLKDIGRYKPHFNGYHFKSTGFVSKKIHRRENHIDRYFRNMRKFIGVPRAIGIPMVPLKGQKNKSCEPFVCPNDFKLCQLSMLLYQKRMKIAKNPE